MVTPPGRRRVLGVATTSHGFAFAVVEEPTRLIDWGQRDVRPMQKLAEGVATLIKRWRPTFVTCEIGRRAHKSSRGVAFLKLLEDVSRNSGGCLVRVETPAGPTRTTNTNIAIAEEMVRHFPALRRVLPRRRRLWDGADDRIGIFLAVFAALSAIRHVGRDDPERKSVYDNT